MDPIHGITTGMPPRTQNVLGYQPDEILSAGKETSYISRDLADVFGAASSGVDAFTPEGLAAIRRSNIAHWTGMSGIASSVGTLIDLSGRISSENPALEVTKWGAGELAADLAIANSAGAIQAARLAGAYGAAAGLTAAGAASGRFISASVENIVDGFVSTDATNWPADASLNDMARSNSRRGPGLYEEARREGASVAGALISSTYRMLGADLKAVSTFLGRFLSS